MTEFADGRHPLCRCPETTFSGGPSAAEVEVCREASGGITHKLIGRLEMDSIMIATRPQDWAAPARAILQERGAWRST